jgi:small-conductance mechanosensitive channel
MMHTSHMFWREEALKDFFSKVGTKLFLWIIKSGMMKCVNNDYIIIFLLSWLFLASTHRHINRTKKNKKTDYKTYQRNSSNDYHSQQVRKFFSRLSYLVFCLFPGAFISTHWSFTFNRQNEFEVCCSCR